MLNPEYRPTETYAPAAPVVPTAPPPVAPGAITTGAEPGPAPRRIGVREALLGVLGLFAILGLVLGVLGFAAAFAADRAVELAVDNEGNGIRDDVELGLAAVPILIVALVPLLAAPVLALGCGSWAGHASRDARVGAIGGSVGSLVGAVAMVLLAGAGFALGAGAAGLNLADFPMPGGLDFSPAWESTLGYVFSAGGLLWLLANALSGGLSGGLLGSLADRWSGAYSASRPGYDRRRVQPRY